MGKTLVVLLPHALLAVTESVPLEVAEREVDVVEPEGVPTPE